MNLEYPNGENNCEIKITGLTDRSYQKIQSTSQKNSKKKQKAKVSNQCSIRTDISNESKNKINSMRPFVVIKNPTTLLEKRPLEKLYESSKNDPVPLENNSSFEICNKIIKCSTSVINLSNPPSKKSLKNGTSQTVQTPILEKTQGLRPPELLDGESAHSTNDDLIEGSNEEIEASASGQLHQPEYLIEFYKKCNSKEDADKKKKFFKSYKPRENETKKKQFLDAGFPLDIPIEEEKKGCDDFTYDLEIVTNKNQREKIKVSFQPGKVNIVDNIPNKMDKEARESFFRQFNFTTDYKSGYAPIDVQAKQEKELTYKNHFIKKKQASSSAKLKRTCGVSYVKALESEQLNVNHIFEKLPPLVFQGSSSCARLEGEDQAFINQVFENIFKEQPNKYIVITILEADDETKIREYLYYPERRLRLAKGKVYLLNSLDSLWYFFKDKQFVCIHLCYDENKFITAQEFKELSQDDALIAISQSNIQLGILCKKSTSGKKAYLKALVEGKWSLEGEDSDSDDEETKKEIADAKSKEMNSVKEAHKESVKDMKPKKMQAENKIEEETNDKAPAKKKVAKESKEEPKEKKEKKGKTEKKEKKKKKKEVKTVLEDLEEEEEDIIQISDEQLSRFENIKNNAFVDRYESSSTVSRRIQNTRDIFGGYEALMSLNGGQTLESSQFQIQTQTTKVLTTESVLKKISFNLTNNNLTNAKTLSKINQGKPIKMDESETDDEEEHTTNNKDSSSWIPPTINKSPKKSSSKKSKEEKQSKNQEPTDNDKAAESEIAPAPKPKLRKFISKASKDPYLAEIVEEIVNESGKNISTLSTRLELYTQEESWKSSSAHTKDLLYTFITHAVDALQEKFREWTKIRTTLSRKGEAGLLLDKKKNVLLFECSTKYDEDVLKSFITPQSNLNWNFSSERQTLNQEILNQNIKKIANIKSLKELGLAELQGVAHIDKDSSSVALPLYQITTRDSFAYDLIEKITVLNLRGREVKKIEYFFDPHSCPSNFKSFSDKFPDYRVGVTTYTNLYSHEELSQIEDRCYETERNFFANHFLPMTGQMTCTSEKVRRTKFFFGARYMWTRQQLSESHSMVGAGIRVDVSAPPRWMKDLVENPMIDASIMEKDFVNSIAMNVYHDGKEGIAQHFDDAVRFKQPIFSLRIFSDSRLSFGSQLYGFCNGAFCIPMPRGCITILEEDSYAANGIKHCVRPCDMTGKSAALILRQMHHKVFNEAKLYDEFVDFPTSFSSLSIQDDAVSYTDQKRIEGEEALKNLKKN